MTTAKLNNLAELVNWMRNKTVYQCERLFNGSGAFVGREARGPASRVHVSKETMAEIATSSLVLWQYQFGEKAGKSLGSHIIALREDVERAERDFDMRAGLEQEFSEFVVPAIPETDVADDNGPTF